MEIIFCLSIHFLKPGRITLFGNLSSNLPRSSKMLLYFFSIICSSAMQMPYLFGIFPVFVQRCVPPFQSILALKRNELQLRVSGSKYSTSFVILFCLLQLVNINIVTDCVAITCQVTRKFKRAAPLKNHSPGNFSQLVLMAVYILSTNFSNSFKLYPFDLANSINSLLITFISFLAFKA